VWSFEYTPFYYYFIHFTGSFFSNSLIQSKKPTGYLSLSKNELLFVHRSGMVGRRGSPRRGKGEFQYKGRTVSTSKYSAGREPALAPSCALRASFRWAA